MRRFIRRLAIRLSIAAVLAVALVLFAAVPAQAAEAALRSGTWDLARFIGAVPQPPSPQMPIVLGAIVLLAAMSSSSGPRRRDRW